MPSVFDVSGNDVMDDMQDSLQELYEDRARFRDEIVDQLRGQIIKHMQLTPRKPSDFIKPRVDEAQAADLQKFSVANHVANLEDKVADMA